MLLNIERARQLMRRDGLDALVLVEPKNVYYFSDYQSDWLFDFPWVSCVVFQPIHLFHLSSLSMT
jgi:hypothetical protein